MGITRTSLTLSPTITGELIAVEQIAFQTGTVI